MVMLRWVFLASRMAYHSLIWCSVHPETPSMKAFCVAVSMELLLVMKHIRRFLRMLVFTDTGCRDSGLKRDRLLNILICESPSVLTV